jgi:cobyrinic acid a,c-diamide synthase
MKAFMVASSGTSSGKTTLTLALMAALRKRGLVAQGFKCGPDFIDPAHHAAITGRPSHNLDSWMLDAETNRDIFQRATRGADVAVIEAMMGLFDGVTGASERGSSAEIAKQLNVPVLLVLDASAAARSLAAVIRGFETFDPGVKVLGVVLNKVAGEGHLRLLTDAIRASCDSPVLGSLPPTSAIHIPERHLGLTTAAEHPLSNEQASLLGDLADNHLDLNGLLNASGFVQPGAEDAASDAGANCSLLPKVRVGVPRDAAFCFYYEENLHALREQGAEIVEFSSLECSQLSAGLDALYFGGGYPELFAERLSSNRSLNNDIRQFASTGKPIYAECGGLIYLAEQLRTIDGRVFPMCGLLPLNIEMTGNLVHFGYAEVTFERDCLLGARGTAARGHSFHYSKVARAEDLEQVYRVSYTLSGRTQSEGFGKGNVLASYIHLHFRSNPTLARSLITRARAGQAIGAVQS